MSDKNLWMKELDRLRLKGNFYHNRKVLHCGGQLNVICRYGPDEDVEFKQFKPCVDCLGFIRKHEFLQGQVSHGPFNEAKLTNLDGTVN